MNPTCKKCGCEKVPGKTKTGADYLYCPDCRKSKSQSLPPSGGDGVFKNESGPKGHWLDDWL